MINTTKIYLVENIDNNPFKVYIGKTGSKQGRKKDHIYTFGPQIIYDYIDEIQSLNIKDWKPIETYWIQQFIAWGFEVVNERKYGGSGSNPGQKRNKYKPNSSKGIPRQKYSPRKKETKPRLNKGRPNPSKGIKRGPNKNPRKTELKSRTNYNYKLGKKVGTKGIPKPTLQGRKMGKEEIEKRRNSLKLFWSKNKK